MNYMWHLERDATQDPSLSRSQSKIKVIMKKFDHPVAQVHVLKLLHNAQ